MQDMGAAGIICSTSEMSAKGESGMRIDLDKVPTRQKGMKACSFSVQQISHRSKYRTIYKFFVQKAAGSL